MLKYLLSLIVSCILVLSAPAIAEDTITTTSPTLSLKTGVDVTNSHYHRGILRERRGVTVQPWAELEVGLYQSEGIVRDVTLEVGTHHSFNDRERTASSQNLRAWNTGDITLGINTQLGEYWTVGLAYTAVTSPNDAFRTFQEITVSASYDDSYLWGDIVPLNGFKGLQPYAAVTFEVDGAADGYDGGTVLEFGIVPSMTLLDSGTFPITLNLPTSISLGLNNYYQLHYGDNDAWSGYIKFGPHVSMPLTFIPDEYGTWNANAGIDLMLLRGNARTINGNSRAEVIYTIGLSASF